MRSLPHSWSNNGRLDLTHRQNKDETLTMNPESRTPMSKQYEKNTNQCAMIGGIPITIPNRTDEVDTDSPHWHISYCSYSADYGCPTTALVIGQSEYFVILCGDHRAGFQQAIDNPERFPRSRMSACLQYCRDHKDELHQRFSDPLI